MPDERLIFIGPLTVTEVEKTILRIFGQALAYTSISLVTSPRGEANSAVVEGYESFKGQPIFKPGKLLDEPADGFLVYTDLDHDLIRTLDGALPTWRRFMPEPIVVQGPDELHDYVYAALAAIKIAEFKGETS